MLVSVCVFVRVRARVCVRVACGCARYFRAVHPAAAAHPRVAATVEDGKITGHGVAAEGAAGALLCAGASLFSCVLRSQCLTCVTRTPYLCV